MAENNDSSSIQHKTLNDHPTLNDELLNNFYGGFINRVVSEVENTQPPKTIAITGYWGSGKTSALASVYHKLTNKVPPIINEPSATVSPNTHSKYVGIWFEAWRYQQEEQPIVALLQAIKEEFSLLSAIKQSVSEKIEMGLVAAMSIFSAQIKDLASGVTVKADSKNVRKELQAYKDENLLSLLPADKINQALEAAITEMLKSDEHNNDKLLIFIDDLDRCQHDTALKLLEGIKLYLNIPNCVIVMAVDQAQLEVAVKKEFGTENRNHFLGVEYLEKLCQDAHRLPLIKSEQAAKFVSAQVLQLIDSHANKVLLHSVIEDLEEIFIKTRCLPANPRRIKMIINRLQGYIAEWSVDEVLSKNVLPAGSVLLNKTRTILATHALAFLVCIQVSYRRIYEQIEWNSDFTARLIDFCDVSNIDGEDDGLWEDAFAGIQKPSNKRKVKDEHPNDLSVFRPYRIIESLILNTELTEGTNLDNHTLVEKGLKQVLPALIQHYNKSPI